MKDEIKEILTNCEKAINEASGYNNTTDKILDYITNLQEENERLLKKSYSDDVRITKATEKLESIRTFGLRSGKTLFSTLINETIDILNGGDKDEYKEMLERFDQICQNAKKELLCAKEEKEQEKKFIEKINKELTTSEYDEIEYWLANIEILNNTDYILNNRKAKILVRYLKEKDKEIEILNNIINELEKDLEDVFYGRGQHFMDSSVVPIKYILGKLKELKEGK